MYANPMIRNVNPSDISLQHPLQHPPTELMLLLPFSRKNLKQNGERLPLLCHCMWTGWASTSLASCPDPVCRLSPPQAQPDLSVCALSPTVLTDSRTLLQPSPSSFPMSPTFSSPLHYPLRCLSLSDTPSVAPSEALSHETPAFECRQNL